MENDVLILHLTCSGLTQILNLSSLSTQPTPGVTSRVRNEKICLTSIFIKHIGEISIVLSGASFLTCVYKEANTD